MYYGADYFLERIPLNFEKYVCDKKKYGSRVRFLRKRTHLTQKGLAESLNNFGLTMDRGDNPENIEKSMKVNRNDISSIERGASINLRSLRLISKFFKCTPSYLLGKTENPESGGAESYVFFLKSPSKKRSMENYSIETDSMINYFKKRYGLSPENKIAITIKIESFNSDVPEKDIQISDLDEILEIVRSKKNGIIISKNNIRDYLYYISKEQFMGDSSPYLSPDFDYARDFELDGRFETPYDDSIAAYPENYTSTEVNYLSIKQRFEETEKDSERGSKLDGLLIVQMCNERVSDNKNAMQPIGFNEPHIDGFYEYRKKIYFIFGIDENDNTCIENRFLLDYLYRLRNKFLLNEQEIIWKLHELYNFNEARWKEYMTIYNALDKFDDVKMKYAKKALDKLMMATGKDLDDFVEAINK